MTADTGLDVFNSVFNNLCDPFGVNKELTCNTHTVNLALCNGSGSSSSSDGKNGFIGSDGKYHAYVPEFGDDVNNRMEENW